MSDSKAADPTSPADPPAPAPAPTTESSTDTPLAAEATSTSAPLQAQPSTDESASSDADADADSALGSEYDPSTYTASLTSSITAYQHEHGRRYHAYQAGRYVLPNDEQEQERMDLQYHAIRLAFADALAFAPIGEKPAAILDVGTGTGIWAVDAADKYPDASVVGTDLSPIQPQWIPPNVKFEVDDAEQAWTFPENHFDLVHTRIMNGSLRDWAGFMKQAFRHVKPGGWVESQELSVDARSDDGSLTEESHIHQWCLRQEKAFSTINASLLMSGEKLRDWMIDAGFVNVTVREFKIPIGTWPADPKLRETGAFQLVAMLDGIQGLTIAAWCNFLGWSEEEVEVELAKVRAEWRSRKIHSYWPL